MLEDALAAQRRGSIGDAKRLYASVLRIDPTNAAAHGNLAIIAAQQGDFAAAERLFLQEIRLRPNDSMTALTAMRAAVLCSHSDMAQPASAAREHWSVMALADDG